MGSVKYGASSRVSAGEGRASSQPGLKYDVRHTLDENSLRMLDKQLKRPMLGRDETLGANRK